MKTPESKYEKMVRIWWESKNPKEFRIAKKEGTMRKQVEELAELMQKEIWRRQDQTKDGMSSMIAEEEVIAEFLN